MSRIERLIAALILPVVLSVFLPAQTFTTLVTLNDGIGSDPEGSLFQGVDGDLYGVVSEASGALYKVTPGGTFTDVFGFCCAAGFRPWVPIGASTGPIVVTIAGSTLRSKNFNVLP